MNPNAKFQRTESGFRRINKPVLIFLLLVVLAAAYYAAAGYEEGITIFVWYENMQKIMQSPWENYWCSYTLPAMGMFFLCFFLLYLYYLTTGRNYMKGKEHGTARFGTAEELNEQLADSSNSDKNPDNIKVIRIRHRFRFWKPYEYRVQR